MTRLLFPLLLFLATPVWAGGPLTPIGDPPRPRFNRLYDFGQVEGFLKGYAKAYPGWVKLETIGRSREKRAIHLLTITNPKSGAEHTKPAMYIDANTHANEVQGTETTLYIVEFLLRNYGRLPRVTELLDRVVFYVIPVVNPDGRAGWFKRPATPHFPRTVMVPRDDDRDGLADEDGYDDLDGDGIITRMRKKVPLGEGNYRLDPKDRRLLVRVKPGEQGDYKRLGFEGYDNDGDGRINEDPVGYVDPNRTWGWDWQPRYVQRGASDYPLQIPETRAIARWALTKPNLAAAQSFHNAGRMILRGPGSKIAPPYPRADIRVYDLIAKEGVRLLPGYRAMVIWKDLYRAHATTVDHFYGVHGAIAFTNELYSAPLDLDGDKTITPVERMKFNDLLTLGRQFVAWKAVVHPQYGPIEVGGFRHDVGRIPEPWMLEVESHRNCAFVLYHAWQLPKLKLERPRLVRLSADLWRLEVSVRNERAIPSMTAIATQNKLHRPDLATVAGATVLASGIVTNPYTDEVKLQRHRPGQLEVAGVPGLGQRRLFFLLQPRPDTRTVKVRYASLKAGVREVEVELPR